MVRVVTWQPMGGRLDRWALSLAWNCLRVGGWALSLAWNCLRSESQDWPLSLCGGRGTGQSFCLYRIQQQKHVKNTRYEIGQIMRIWYMQSETLHLVFLRRTDDSQCRRVLSHPDDEWFQTQTCDPWPVPVKPTPLCAGAGFDRNGCRLPRKTLGFPMPFPTFNWDWSETGLNQYCSACTTLKECNY